MDLSADACHGNQKSAITNELNTLRPRQGGRYFAGDVLKCIFLNENVWILRKIQLKFVPMGSINNIEALVQIMAWRRPGDKPLPEPMLVFVTTHLCVTRPQWVKWRSNRVRPPPPPPPPPRAMLTPYEFMIWWLFALSIIYKILISNKIYWQLRRSQ